MNSVPKRSHDFVNSKPEFQQFLTEQINILERRFPLLFNPLKSPEILKEAMLYSLHAGGKRIRPVLLLSVLHAAGKPLEAGYRTAAALELIHTYSLVHDDLPAMDDDDLRRGKPTNHKVYGEDIAILAGDGLLTHSFNLISKDEHLSADLKVALIADITDAVGPEGMVGGQVADMQGEGKVLTAEQLEAIHHRKTGDLLSVSLMAGGKIAGLTDEDNQHLSLLGKHLGLAFQIKDDLLDIEGTVEEIGKPVGSDEGNNKNTYPSLLGIDGAKEKLNIHLDEARSNLQRIRHFNPVVLDGLITYIGERKT